MGEATEDAPQESVQAAAPTKTPVWGRRLWLAGRVGATVGAVGFALASWTFFVRVSDGAQALNLNPGDVAVDYTGGFGWALISVLGLLLMPLVWLNTRRPIIDAAISALFIFGGIAAFTMVMESPDHVFGRGASLVFVDGLAPHSIVLIQGPEALIGQTLAAIAVLVVAASGLLMSVAVVTEWRSPQRISVTAVGRVPGAGWLTLGLVVFLIGILEMGWAAVDCTATPLFVGQCNGLSFSSVLHYGIATHTDAFDPVAALYAIPTLLVGGAALALVGVWWWRRLTPGLCLWITLYLAIATFFFVVAYAGVGAIVAEASALGLQAGRWTGQIGIMIAGAGLVIGWGAAVVLWVRALRPGRPEVAVQLAG